MTAKKPTTQKSINISNSLMYDLSEQQDTLEFFDDVGSEFFGNLIQETLDLETLNLIEELDYDYYANKS